MTPVTPVDVPKLKRQFPQVDGVADWRAQQSLRLLWERVFDLEGRLQAAEGTLVRLVGASNTHEAQLKDVDEKADAALAQAALTAAEVQRIAGEAGGTGGTGGGGKDDLGLGAVGCSNAGPDGHLTEPFELTVQNAGRIVCGVGNEFPALMAAVATQAERDANRDELLDRMVWHLNQAGFASARYIGTGDEHTYNLFIDCLALDGAAPVREYAYRVVEYDPIPHDPTNVMTTVMVCNGQTPGATTTPDAGIPD